MEFNKDFSDMLSALNDANVDFLVVGAYAVAAHGYPRATGDLDIWIRADAETAPRVLQALTQFGAPLHNLNEADLATPSLIFQIGVPPGRIDLLTVVSGLTFDEAWKNRVVIQINGIEFPIIGRSDLILNKRATGRPKDLADLHELEANAYE